MHDTDSLTRLAADLGDWARELGFARLGIARAEVGDAAARLAGWLAAGRHGEMDYMARHAALRSQPQALLPGTLTVISVALDYWPEAGLSPALANLANLANLADQERAYISRYALGRDYHKVMRRRLQKLASRMENAIGPFGYRVFCDSAPVLEVEFARQAGLGWRGKHSLLLSRQGSWRFLGEIYTDLALPTSAPERDHCGSCTACLAACPTQAIIAPYQVDARRCISYLTIELAGAIPEALRPQIGNRIYGCDDCQLGCPGTASPGWATRNSRPARGWTGPPWWTSLPGKPGSSRTGWRAVPSAASAMNAGCATSPWPWATAPPPRRPWQPWNREKATPRRWCRNMSPGPSPGWRPDPP